jgi:haloacetate dehalogenase
MYFEGFGPPELVAVTGGALRLRRAGTGPALLLLHGHPQTHAMWHDVAPRLARRFTVVCPDLPGYGGSLRHLAADAEGGTGRAMAARLLEAADALGIGRFAVAGHDRGGRVAHRLALVAPERVEKIALLDVVPVPAPVERADMAFALATYRMFWFAQTHPKPEALFPSVPGDWFTGTLPGDERQGVFHPDAVADYVATVSDTEAMAALDAAYRRAAELDGIQDRMDGGGDRRVACPALVLWAARGSIGGWYDPVALWREHVAGPISGRAIEAGHFLAEEQPALVAELLGGFFG